MRKAGISIAKYDETVNQVIEKVIKSDTYWSKEMSDFFEENVDLPIYGYYNDDFYHVIIAESFAYIKEYAKISD